MKLSVSLADIMADPNLSITSSPFAPGKTIVKRASFPAGEVPPHLAKYLIKKGQCKGEFGTTVYKGKVVPKTAKCVAEGGKKK